jgi:hypothetical protein
MILIRINHTYLRVRRHMFIVFTVHIVWYFFGVNSLYGHKPILTELQWRNKNIAFAIWNVKLLDLWAKVYNDNFCCAYPCAIFSDISLLTPSVSLPKWLNGFLDSRSENDTTWLTLKSIRCQRHILCRSWHDLDNGKAMQGLQNQDMYPLQRGSFFCSSSARKGSKRQSFGM